LLRGNVVDLAVAVVIGTAFGAIVAAFTKAFITPLILLIGGGKGAFADKSFTVSGSRFPYGEFVDAIISFVIIAAVIYFFVVLPVQKLMDRYKTEPEPGDPVKECPECLSKIPEAAIRCAFCTVEQLEPA
jgi:large conductance mechanosensitive channel